MPPRDPFRSFIVGPIRRHSDRAVAVRRWRVSLVLFALLIGIKATAQNNTPQTRLVPINPGAAAGRGGPPPGSLAPANNFGSGGFAPSNNFATPNNFGVQGGASSSIGLPPATSTFGGPTFTPSTSFGNTGPTFDPYATPIRGGPGITPAAPSVGGTAVGGSGTGGLFGGLFSRPVSGGLGGGFNGGPILNSPAITTPPGTFDNPSVYGPPVTYPSTGFGSGFGGGLNAPPAFSGPPAFPGSPTYPDSIYPQSTPSTLFPGGLFSGGPVFGNAAGGPAVSAFRFLNGPRIRHTWIAAGDDDDDLEVNTTDASVIFAFPNFLYGTQPIYVIPSFSLHLFDGPNSSTGADLPGQTYSAFLDFGYNSDPNRILGTELGVRVGVFSDFDHFQSDALRILGKGLINFRLTPSSTVKFGVYYLDRLDWKVLPAGGILYQPDPYTRFDIFFPQPKFAKYWRTIGTQDVWWYLAGDYGGGSWAIEREDGDEDQFDLNELQATFGIEWGRSQQIRSGRRVAFAEVGYVFDRELVYRSGSPSSLGVDDAFMFRLGFGY